MAKTHPDNHANPPEHVVAVAQRMLALAWLSPQLRADLERNVARLRAEQAQR